MSGKRKEHALHVRTIRGQKIISTSNPMPILNLTQLCMTLTLAHVALPGLDQNCISFSEGFGASS